VLGIIGVEKALALPGIGDVITRGGDIGGITAQHHEDRLVVLVAHRLHQRADGLIGRLE
jgi:hypothetical protein